MSCTCAKRQLPCPIHGEKGLPVPDEIEHHCLVIRVYQRKDGGWFATVTKDAIVVFQTENGVAKDEAIILAVQFLMTVNQKPNQK